MMKKTTDKIARNGKGKRPGLWAVSLVVSLQVMALVLFSMATPGSVESKTFIVNSTLDETDATPGDGACESASGTCTLRAAIQEANALTGADVIKLKAGLYMLTIAGASEDACATGDLDIQDDLTIIGKGAKNTFINAGQLDRVFDIPDPVSVTIAKVTIQNGAEPHGRGGAIHNLHGILTLEGVTISNNFAFGGDSSYGGGICNYATLTMRGSTVSNNLVLPLSISNFACGGGIFNWGNLTITGSTISTNSLLASNPWAQGGGIFHENGTLTIIGSTLSNNIVRNVRTSGEASGGGIYSAIGTVTIKKSTLSNNSVLGGDDSEGGYGGGIANQAALLTITASTLSNNSASGYSANGGGVTNLEGPLTITGSKILNNVVRGEVFGCGGGILSQDSEVTIEQSTISGNAASCTSNTWRLGYGGGIFLNRGTLTVQNASKIVRNFSTSACGGICYWAGTGSISADSSVTKNIPDDTCP